VTRVEAENAIVTLLAKGGVAKGDLAELALVKDRIFSDISGLERVLLAERDPSLGGLQGLRAWLERQRPLLTMDLRERGLRPPRGVLLVGVPGCGKSLSAKAIAASWNLSLYRLDLANIHGQYLGQSESRLREALATADRVAPAVLWIDEIEKGLASDGDDAGPGKRILGTLLTWMAERKDRVFLVATANDIEALPPELLRKGRFDEIFFIDLPSAAERREIFRIHVEKRQRDPARFDLDALGAAAEGFSGSEIEQAVVAGLYLAFAEGGELTQAHVMRALQDTFPLSSTMGEDIARVRDWSKNRTRPASSAQRLAVVR